MKSFLLIFALVLAAGGLSRLSAQVLPPTAPDTSTIPGSPDASGYVPARNIMPTALNHTPHATPPPPEIAAGIDRFFKGLTAGDYANAYDTFLTGTRLGTQKAKESTFISKTQEAFGLYGGLTDYEVFDNYSIGKNVLVLTYLSRHPTQPLRWRFIYYRPAQTWGLINMGFDDVLLDLLD